MRRNTKYSYGVIARTFHWITAGLILTLLIGGFLTQQIPRTAEYINILTISYSTHKTLGIIVLCMAVLRIIWAIVQPSPAPLHPERKLETFAAEVVHYALYIAIIVMPLSGWVKHAAQDGFAPIYWPFSQNLFFVPKSILIADIAGAFHFFAAWCIVFALVAHIGGAMKHALIDRDQVLARMTKGVEAGSVAGAQSKAHAVVPMLAVVGWIGVLCLAFYVGQGKTQAELSDAPVARSTIAQASEASETNETNLPQWDVVGGSIKITVEQFGAQVQGEFGQFTSSIVYDEGSGRGETTIVIETATISLGGITDTVKGVEFFNIEAFSQAQFEAQIHRVDNQEHQAQGHLTLVGISAPVTLDFSLEIENGVAQVVGVAHLDRRDFKIGLSYEDEATVGYDVRVDIELEANRL